MERETTQPKTKLGPPPSSDFSWTSILRRKLTRNNRLDEKHALGRTAHAKSHVSQQQENHRKEVGMTPHERQTAPPAIDSVEDRETHNKTLRGALENHPVVDVMHVGEVVNTGSSTSAKRTNATPPAVMPVEEDASDVHPYTSAAHESPVENPSADGREFQQKTSGDARPDQEQDTMTRSPSNTKTASRGDKQQEAKKSTKQDIGSVERTSVDCNRGSEVERQHDCVKERVWQILTHKLKG
jgi:hypothetical protein